MRPGPIPSRCLLARPIQAPRPHPRWSHVPRAVSTPLRRQRRAWRGPRHVVDSAPLCDHPLPSKAPTHRHEPLRQRETPRDRVPAGHDARLGLHPHLPALLHRLPRCVDGQRRAVHRRRALLAALRHLVPPSARLAGGRAGGAQRVARRAAANVCERGRPGRLRGQPLLHIRADHRLRAAPVVPVHRRLRLRVSGRGASAGTARCLLVRWHGAVSSGAGWRRVRPG